MTDTDAPAALQTAVLGCAGPELAADLAFRAMFGGIMGYVRGRPFVVLSRVGLALKLGQADRDALLATPGAAPLRFKADGPVMAQYVVAPRAMLDAPEELGAWLARAAAPALAQAPRAPRRR